MEIAAVTLMAAAISLAGFLASARTSARSADAELVRLLQSQVTGQQTEIRDLRVEHAAEMRSVNDRLLACENARGQLAQRELELLRALFEATGKVHVWASPPTPLPESEKQE